MTMVTVTAKCLQLVSFPFPTPIFPSGETLTNVAYLELLSERKFLSLSKRKHLLELLSKNKPRQEQLPAQRALQLFRLVFKEGCTKPSVKYPSPSPALIS
uniref:Uncharacterized protein n=1 Tax=Opuntia streptacantha TaxID=393608 RepID=A0A7C8YIJ8_OPUST